MKLDTQMNLDAAKYAKHLADLGTLAHSNSSDRQGDGENLAYICASKNNGYTGAEPTQQWLVSRLFIFLFFYYYLPRMISSILDML